MTAATEMPLLRNDEHTNPAIACCNGHCIGDSSSKTPRFKEEKITQGIMECEDESSVTRQFIDNNCNQVIPTSNACNGSNRAFPKRLPSRDSGFGASLDTITEQHECPGHHGQNTTEETDFGPRNASVPAFTSNRNDSITSETPPIPPPFNGQCNGFCKTVSNGFHDHRAQNLHMMPLPNGRTRSKSESCQNCVQCEPNFQMETRILAPEIQSCSSANGDYCEVERNDCETGEAKPPIVNRCDTCFRIMTLILSIVLILVFAGCTVTVIRMKTEGDLKMQKMETKISVLEKSVKILNRTSLQPSFDMIKSNNAGVRPHTHLLLLGEKDITVDNFNHKVLQWTFGTNVRQRSSGIKFDSKTRSLTVQEPGLYFVYNQVYVFRNVVEPRKNMDDMYNHTLQHVIYRKPVNFPSKKKPYIVTASALTQCWDEKANNQIHTSYQGVIVKLQFQDQLYVALENYNEEFDKLIADKTYFGAFKL